MSRRTQRAKTQLSVFLTESRTVFRRQYAITEMPSVLIAQDYIETCVEDGKLDAKDALALIHDQAAFAELLLKSEDRYQKRQGQEIRTRMTNLERNTDWKVAAVISLGTGMVTGLVFALASPFIATWLQPSADQLLKRQHSGTAQTASQSQPVPNNYTVNNYTTTNQVYIFSPHDSAPVSPRPAPQSKPQYKLACKNETIESYKKSLLELLQGGKIVTLEANGKRVSLCYRPYQQSAGQPKTLAK